LLVEVEDDGGEAFGESCPHTAALKPNIKPRKIQRGMSLFYRCSLALWKRGIAPEICSSAVKYRPLRGRL
jgi:hypothetical protein